MSIVAHDLRQPLSSIQGFTSVLMMDNPQGGTGNSDLIALNNIIKATDNMNLLMADLMDISMIDFHSIIKIAQVHIFQVTTVLCQLWIKDSIMWQ